VSRIGRIETEVASIRDLLTRSHPSDHEPSAIAAERDDLRARNVNLQDSLVRLRAVLEVQQRADDERSVMVDHLLAAAAAGERVDALRRRAISELDEALAGFTRPGHIGHFGSG
jgi:hypothetical protein